MEKQRIQPYHSTYRLFNKVNDKIVEWDLDARVGYGMLLKHHHYAHVQLKVY